MTKSDNLSLSPCHNVIWILDCFHNHIQISCHIVVRFYDMYPAFVCNPYRNAFFRYRSLHALFTLNAKTVPGI